jgi:molecular chaperone GrpE
MSDSEQDEGAAPAAPDDGGGGPAAAAAAEPMDAVPLDDVALVVEDEIIDLVDTEVDPVERERDEYLDALRRLQADFDNYRKRVQREVAEAGDRALGSFVEGLLPVLDAVDAARAHGVGEVESIASLLVESLAKQGLERIDPVGDVFDPTKHEAVVHEEGDGSGVQTVAEVYRAGWVWKGRVLRAAMVKVIG